ncbi:FAD-binding domain-containing protein [Neolentinus lepideus HHB14362 ss-1]|uniref:D-lactate dehydrogenase (cytochrome) n=1 Tax=Neolentinus lepideus HHB14362 ss-1 TaxID=1314782 RepID=A0A165ULM8_9AGAM|nr:FAD-binding domain-containing protein [Neolentinus lepideus HHB14362 ss-1]
MFAMHLIFIPLQEHALQELRRVLPEPGVVSTDPDELWGYAQSVYTQLPGRPHSIVVHARSTDDVVKVVNISRRFLVPIVPCSGGTSLEGNLSAPESPSICIDLSGMDCILEINEADADVVLQPGVTWTRLNEILKEKNIPLFFPLDPAPSAAIGGMIATGCSGTNAVRYGTARAEWILNVTVVLPSGEVIKTRQRARKSSAGFDLTKLFIGSEGTLGIITEATIRLAPLLPTRVAVVQFPDVRQATEAVCDFMTQIDRGVRVHATECAELLDSVLMKGLNMASPDEGWSEKDTLFLKFQGSPSAIHETSEVVKTVCGKHGGTGYRLAHGETEAEKLWDLRRHAFLHAAALRPGARGWAMDVCVPVSKLPDLIYAAKEDITALNMIAPIGGHIGDGNFHALVLYQGAEEMNLVEEITSRIVHKAIALGGTCTGEHGVGTRKRHFLPIELGQGTVNVMTSIKRTIDPHNLFNPGKLYPDGHA